ncbi:tyrosine-type recombinase/integrase [Enterococcus montenegrensis]|uniref:tyrosine-type recombinase/integrase n=1 Tax=Enterococcus montenegrensis TaxID=3031993 RepID=UPI00249F013C|nr:tyrosine-type recombinase/integrase [Enterococcus montenegrensis]WHA09722.1 tyrosine-type recombinase/integrase [Enterococcus montenegrensis]
MERYQYGHKQITIHKLRHTHVSILSDLGVPLKDISARLGHKEVATTKEFYLYSSDEQ